MRGGGLVEEKRLISLAQLGNFEKYFYACNTLKTYNLRANFARFSDAKCQ